MRFFRERLEILDWDCCEPPPGPFRLNPNYWEVFDDKMASSHSFSDPSIVISIFSLVVASVTLYLSQFRGPQLSHVAGPTIVTYYGSDGGFGLFLPITFINKSARTGTIIRCGITIFKASSPEERFFMEWYAFSRWEEDRRRWVFEEM